MILSDSEVKDRVNKQDLIQDHDPDRIKYCGYELRLGKVFTPTTGRIQWVESQARGLLKRISTTSRCFVINPSETMVVVTKESLKMPVDLCATYGQLNRLANRGLMILNTSIVEPGYQGPLSCVLVNFSSQRHALSPGESIAKINFHLLKGSPQKLQEKVDRDRYEQMVAKNATSLPMSLLDIAGIEERVSEKVGAAVRKSILFGGVVIAILLLWSQLEGVFSNWLWQRTGLRSTTKQVELMLEKQRLHYEKENQDLKVQIDDLAIQLEKLKGSNEGSP